MPRAARLSPRAGRFSFHYSQDSLLNASKRCRRQPRISFSIFIDASRRASQLERTPFPIKALQVDGGSEFAAEFEEACLQKKVTPVRAGTQITEAQRPRGTVQPHPQRGVLRSPDAVRPGAHAEPPTAGLGENLQLRPPASVFGLPHSTLLPHSI